MCVLLGYGADAICPYMIMEATKNLRSDGVLSDKLNDKEVFGVNSAIFFFDLLVNIQVIDRFFFFRTMSELWRMVSPKSWPKWAYPLYNLTRELRSLRPLDSLPRLSINASG